MLIGALMVLAPGGAGAAQLDPVPIDANTCPQDGYDPGTDKINAGDAPSVFVEAPEGYLIDGYCVKTGSESSGDGPLWIGFDPPVASTTITYPGKDTISHYAVSYVPIEVGRLSVAKVVTGAEAPGTETEFGFTVDCGDVDLNGEAAGTDAVFTLTDGEAAWVSPDIAAGTVCTVTETDDQGATTVTYSVADGEVTIVDGQTSPVVVTNDFPGEIPPPPPPPVTTPTPASLTVEKVVAGLPDATAVPAAWSEIIDIDSVGASNPVSNVSVDQGDLSTTQTVAAGTYRLDELGADGVGMSLTDIECTEANGAVTSTSTLVDAADLRDGIDVTLAQGSDMTCVFTNTYVAQEVSPEEEEPGFITIVKAVQGPVPTDGWAFGFDVSDGFGQVILTNADADETFNSVKAGQYTITEHDNSATTLGSIACDDPDAVSNGRTVTVDVSEGEDVTCTFTNVFPPVAQTSTEVKGDVVTRTLPRTGDETRNLAGVGAFMLALGAAMVLGSKRQLAGR